MMVSEIDKLDDRINQLREELIQIAKATGLKSNETLRYSQKLDDLITMFQISKNEQYKKVWLKVLYYHMMNMGIFFDFSFEVYIV